MSVEQVKNNYYPPNPGYFWLFIKLLSAYSVYRPGRLPQVMENDLMRWPSSANIRKHPPFDKTVWRLMDNCYCRSLERGCVDNPLKYSDQLVLTLLLLHARRIIRWYTGAPFLNQTTFWNNRKPPILPEFLRMYM